MLRDRYLLSWLLAATLIRAAAPDSAASHRELGRNYLAAHMPDQALVEFQQSLALEPNDADSLDAIGSILGDSGDMPTAVSYFLAAIRSRPEMLFAHYHLALAYARMKRLEEAISEYEDCLWLNQNFTPARYAFSALCLAMGDIDGAVFQLRRVLDSIPNISEPHYNLAVALRRKGLHDNEAIAEFREAVRLDPSNVRALTALGELLAERREFKSAEEALRAALLRTPDSAETHYTLGLVLRTANQLGDAEAEFRKALDLDPKHALARRALALLLRQNHSLDLARSELERVVQELPNDAASHYNLGSILMQLGDPARAIPELRTAFQLDSLLTAAGFLLVQALSKTGQLSEAELFRQLAEDSDRRKKNAGQSIVLLQMAAEHSTKGELAAAVQVLSDAAELTPDFADVHYQLALALRKSGDHNECERELRAVLELKPDRADAHFELGVMLEQDGKLEGAIQEFVRAVSGTPSQTTALGRLGFLCIKTQQFERAAFAFKGLIAWNGTNASAHLWLARTFLNLDKRELAIAEFGKVANLDQSTRTDREVVLAARAELDDLIKSKPPHN